MLDPEQFLDILKNGDAGQLEKYLCKTGADVNHRGQVSVYDIYTSMCL